MDCGLWMVDVEQEAKAHQRVLEDLVRRLLRREHAALVAELHGELRLRAAEWSIARGTRMYLSLY